MRNERAICARLTGDKPLKQGDSTYETPWKGRPPRQRHGWSPEWGGEVGIGGCQGLLWGDKRVLEPDGDGADGYTVLCALNGTQAHPAKWLILIFTILWVENWGGVWPGRSAPCDWGGSPTQLHPWRLPSPPAALPRAASRHSVVWSEAGFPEGDMEAARPPKA